MTVRILFVEKNATAADLLVPGMERKGYQVYLARTQHEATSRIRTVCPDLLIVDVASFGTKGYQVSDVVRARVRELPTILLLPQGHASAGSTADAFMTPPFTSRKLLYRIKKLATSFVHRQIRAGHLSLDPKTCTLRKGEEIVHLRPKEAALLALFMNNSGRVLSRQELIKRVWETDYFDDTRTLSVHVRWLRLKIEENPNHPELLRTVRGVGYRFEVPGSRSPD